MALSGLEIYKLLAKTNCKRCGFQTCLAFAMQLAKRTEALDKCPYVSPEARRILEEASQPAIRLVEFGPEGRRVRLGRETVLFRHEERFHHPTAVGFLLDDAMSDADFERALSEIAYLRFERVGEKIEVDVAALRQTSADGERFLRRAKKISDDGGLALILMAASPQTLEAALETCGRVRPLVYSEDASRHFSFAALCRKYRVPLAVRGAGVSEFAALSGQLGGEGIQDIVFDIPPVPTSERLWQLTQLRRLAVKKHDRRLGFPAMVIVDDEEPATAVCRASVFIAKYAGLVLVKTRRPEHVLPLLTLRQNIFTDPQKPLQVQPGIYPVGSANEHSPVLVTTNFSLTYYTVLAEIEASRVASHLLCVDTEGMSVLTAWAAEKFTPERIADSLIKFRVPDAVRHKNLVIPGYVAVLSGDLEEKSGWNVRVGPREASGLPSYLKNLPRS